MKKSLSQPLITVTPFAVVAAFLVVLTNWVWADDFPQPYNSEQDQSAQPLSPLEAAASLQVPDGFRVSVFAAEPEVRNPIAMSWDTRGRLWVAENYTYAERAKRFDLSLRDRVLIFEDTDADGVADRQTVFTDQIQMLTGIEVGFGGVWLMCPPRLLFIPDADGDDVPDGPAQVVLDGFDVADANYHNLANGLRFGPDGWLYGRCGGSCPGRIGRPGTADDQRFALEGGIWRYHPTRNTCEVLSAGTTNPWGHDWNEVGELFFTNTVNGHLWHLIPGAHYVRPFTLDPNPRTYQSIDMHADHWHFDVGKSWTDSRDGAANSYGGGHAHCGTLIYQADQWPEEYRGRLMTLNFHGRRVNQETLHRIGSGYVASHGDDILISGDPFFRGIDLSTGPDGSVFLLDWSDTGECHEGTGVHRTSGRIFQVRYTGESTDAAASPHQNHESLGDIAQRSSSQLVALHRHRNQWQVRAARKVLQQRAAAGMPLQQEINELQNLVRSQEGPLAVAAIMTLLAMDRLDAALAVASLEHPHESVRAWAIRGLSDRWPIDDCYGPVQTVEHVDADLLARLVALAADDSGLVRLTLASTLQRLPLADRFPLAKALGARAEDADDHNLPLMVWYGLMPAVEAEPLAAAEVAVACRWPLTSRLIVRRLAERLDEAPEGLNPLIDQITQSGDREKLDDLIEGISQGLKGWRQAPQPPRWNELVSLARAGTRREATAASLQELSVIFGDGLALEEIRAAVLDESREIGQRRSALLALVNQRPDDLVEICGQLLRDARINAIAARGMATANDPEAARKLVNAYNRFRGPERPGVIAILASRPAFAEVLLSAVDSGRIRRQDITAYDARAIDSLGDPPLSDRLRAVWGEIRQTPQQRQDAMQTLKALLTAEDSPPVDLPAGRLIYNDLCAKCHKLYGYGETIGPDLTGSNRDNLDYLIENVMDPSAVVDKDYRVSIVAMDDGRILSGVIVSQTERTLSLQTQTELVVVPQESVDEIKLTTQSPMPEGQLEGLTEQQIRNLFGYLRHPVQVPLP